MMIPFTRRNFLITAAGTLAAARLSGQGSSAVQATLTIPSESNGATMPVDFGGLSYELRQLTDPTFFSDKNTSLVQAFKSLTTHGVLRLGGNTSEFAWWKATADSPEPQHPATREVQGEPKAQYYAVTPDSVRNLARFLKATGWNCIYGINMGTNTPECAAAEAEFVANSLGENLQYFQIGNEVDLFNRHLRAPKTWNAKKYLAEWLTLARAISEKVPSAKFGMPDVASDVAWLTEISDSWVSMQNPLRVTTISHHYYFGGPATNPDVNILNLLNPSTMSKIQNTANQATAAARKMNVRVRMTEGNTCYRGGKPGVSDVFAAALWSADYSLLLASNNYSGINLHGGTGESVAVSVGGFLPGDVMLKDNGKTPEEIASYPHPFYTPIATFGEKYALQPVGYGLKFALLLSGGSFIKGNFTSTLQNEGINATAYAVKLANGRVAVVVLNKDSEKNLDLRIDFGKDRSEVVQIDTLAAQALDSREVRITQNSHAEQLQGGVYTVKVSRATGICLMAQ
jgi:hypothetical protein